MNVGSLFTGVGGFDLGFERAGMRVVWRCEANPWRRRVLRRHWPGVPCYDDVRDVGDPRRTGYGEGSERTGDQPRRGLHARPNGRYAAMGDAVTVNVAHWIGSRIMAVTE